MPNNYDYIVNPKTKRKVRINTNLGKSILKKYKKEMFGGGCEFQSEEKEHFSSYEYKCILEQLKIRDDYRKEEINKLRKLINDQILYFISKIKRSDIYDKDCTNLQEPSMTASVTHYIGNAMRRLNPRNIIALTAEAKAEKIYDESQKSDNIAQRFLGKTISNMIKKKAVNKTIEENNKRLKEWRDSFGDQAVKNCKEKKLRLEKYNNFLVELKNLLDNLDNKITDASLIEVQHNEMITITQNCEIDKMREFSWFDRQSWVRKYKLDLFKKKYSELKLNNPSINRKIDEHIDNRTIDKYIDWHIFGNYFDIMSFFSNINIILSDKDEDRSISEKANRYADETIFNFIDGIVSSEDTEKDKLSPDEIQDLNTQSKRYSCDKCRCEPNLRDDSNVSVDLPTCSAKDFAVSHAVANEISKKAAHYIKCLGDIWTEDQLKILNDVMEKYNSIRTENIQIAHQGLMGVRS